MMKKNTISKLTKRLSILIAVCFLFTFVIGIVPSVPSLNAAAVPTVMMTLFVSPDGDDNNPGTEQEPFESIQKARDTVRAVNGNFTGDVIVNLRGGTYKLNKTLEFDQSDSGRDGFNVIYQAYPGETPVISGGRSINGWQEVKGSDINLWKQKTNIDNFRQLYVNGVRAQRARSDAPLQGAAKYGTLGGLEDMYKPAGFTTTDVNMANWGNQSDIEFGFYTSWSHMIVPVEKITADGSGKAIVIMQQPGFFLATRKEGVQANMPAYIENAFELLDQPGEWYLDRTENTVYYIPRAGEDMKTAEVIAPVLEKIMEVKGTLDTPVHNIQFEGITFAYGSWLQPSSPIGHPDVQGNFITGIDNLFYRGGFFTKIHNEYIKSQANVVIDAAKFIRFERCTFTKLGSAGLDIQHGSQDNIVSGSEFYDISGSGIQVGDVLKNDHHPDDPRLIVKNNQVVNNYIHEIGAQYQDSLGIWVGYTENTRLAHNEISNLPYSGISVGWGWGEEDAGGNPLYTGVNGQPFVYDTPTSARENKIEYNNVHDVMQLRHDGATIYTLGAQPDSVERYNYMHDANGMPGGIYHDEGSAYFTTSYNVVQHVQRFVQIWTPSIHDIVVQYNYSDNTDILNNGTNCTVSDNIFVLDGNWPQEALDIMANAGLEPAYRDLLP